MIDSSVGRLPWKTSWTKNTGWSAFRVWLRRIPLLSKCKLTWVTLGFLEFEFRWYFTIYSQMFQHSPPDSFFYDRFLFYTISWSEVNHLGLGCYSVAISSLIIIMFFKLLWHCSFSPKQWSYKTLPIVRCLMHWRGGGSHSVSLRWQLQQHGIRHVATVP